MQNPKHKKITLFLYLAKSGKKIKTFSCFLYLAWKAKKNVKDKNTKRNLTYEYLSICDIYLTFVDSFTCFILVITFPFFFTCPYICHWFLHTQIHSFISIFRFFHKRDVGYLIAGKLSLSEGFQGSDCRRPGLWVDWAPPL